MIVAEKRPWCISSVMNGYVLNVVIGVKIEIFIDRPDFDPNPHKTTTNNWDGGNVL